VTGLERVLDRRAGAARACRARAVAWLALGLSGLVAGFLFAWLVIA